jgi:tripartite-type tricarboxylate transporter receptor subunit TctC
MKRLTTLGLAMAGLMLAAGVASAQALVNRPVRLVVTSVPGGPSDLVARMVAPRLAEALGRNVVVDSRGSVGGIVAAEIAAKSIPDGSTLMVGNSGSHAINSSLYKKLPYDAIKDFAPISQMVSASMVLVANPKLGMDSLKDFIDAAKKQPGKFNIAIAGSTGELAGNALMAQAGMKLTNVPYKGSAPAEFAVVAGEADVTLVTAVASVSNINAGRLKALGITGSRRSLLLANVPTISEAGVPGYDFAMWHGLLAPAGTSPQLVKSLNQSVVRILNAPELRDRLTSQGFDVVANSPEEFAAVIKRDTERFRAIVIASGIKPQ